MWERVDVNNGQQERIVQPGLEEAGRQKVPSGVDSKMGGELTGKGRARPFRGYFSFSPTFV